MTQINHPAAREELRHLEETLSAVGALTQTGGEELTRAEAELNEARRFDPDMLPLREMMYARAAQNMKNLALAALKPYFTRINFTEENGQKQVYYIGKYGLTTPDFTEIIVVDWRSPVANLYYSGQVGPMRYAAPDGEVAGELTLKRQLGIEDGSLKTIFDTDVVSQDAYLQSVLGAAAGDRLREIVTTIQAEQNFVIRHPLDVSLVVQGVAGSGKTTIALHRIAYLLYAFQDRLRPEHMVILAPNPLFLSFIAGVLPDLGVDRVRQTTFPAFVAGWLGDLMPPMAASPAGEAGPDARQAVREMGKLSFAARLDEWMDDFSRRFAQAGEIRFGPATLFTQEQLTKHLLEDQKPFPLARRLAEFKKELAARTKDAARRITLWLQEETDRRVDKIRASMPDGEEKRLRLVSLYHSRDQRIKEVQDKARPFIREVMARFPALKPLELYRAFWKDMAEGDDAGLRVAAAYCLSRLSAGKIAPEDAAPIALIAMRTHELPALDVRHLVVDEAQDFSALQFLMLRRVTRGASMTIVGDLMQGIRAWRGLPDWRILTDELFEGKAVMHHLLTSYRSTIEIMNAALGVARKRPVPGQKEARPVLRHGPEPEYVPFASPDQQAAAILALIRKWRSEGMASIAVIHRFPEALPALHRALADETGANIMDVEAGEYALGVVLARAQDVKGFEFDGVILADAGENCFADTEEDARLLYVCLTRPLHRLACLYEGALTPLLADGRER